MSTQRIKEQVTEFDKKTRTLLGILNRIHSTRSEQSERSPRSLSLRLTDKVGATQWGLSSTRRMPL